MREESYYYFHAVFVLAIRHVVEAARARMCVKEKLQL
jgi:hypothetical protein